jgi:hypothetical protein
MREVFLGVSVTAKITLTSDFLHVEMNPRVETNASSSQK